MHTNRTRFANDIIAEFLPPNRTIKKQKIIILLDGVPSVPSKKSVMEFFSKKGFWVFHPRYRGCWESDGKFLKHSPTKDVLDVINGIHSGFTDLWNDKRIQITPNSIYLISSSFGGPAGLIASEDLRVTKAVVISPVIDWTKTSPTEPINELAKFMTNAYGQGYRTDPKGWRKLKSGKFYNPVNHAKTIPGNKILLIHAKDDKTCSYSQTSKFSKTIKAKLITVSKGGHFGASIMTESKFYKHFQNFIKNDKVK